MEEKFLYTKIWRVNGVHVISDNPKDAIDIFSDYYKSKCKGESLNIQTLVCVEDNLGRYDAIIRKSNS